MGPPPLWTYRARPIRAVDGDGLLLLVDLGFGARYEADVRLDGIDAPEIGTEAGRAAWRYLWHDLLGPAFLQGASAWPLLVRTRKTRTGREDRSFARYVGWVGVIGANGAVLDVADALAAAGHARRATAKDGGRE